VRFAFRSTDTRAASYDGELQGYAESLCDLTVTISNATDCITRLSVAFDELGNGHTLIYKRLYGETLETVGYGDVSVDDLMADETPESGCLSGYQLGFAEPVAAVPTVGASRAGRMLSAAVVSLQRVLTVSNEAIDNALFVVAAQIWAAYVAEQERINNLPRFCDVNLCYDDEDTLTQEQIVAEEEAAEEEAAAGEEEETGPFDPKTTPVSSFSDFLEKLDESGAYSDERVVAILDGIVSKPWMLILWYDGLPGRVLAVFIVFLLVVLIFGFWLYN
jgi:hypothetical protein